jgi:hypothetical protein
VYQQQQQEQEQEQQQQQDAENPFLDPPFSRIKTRFPLKFTRTAFGYFLKAFMFQYVFSSNRTATAVQYLDSVGYK